MVRGLHMEMLPTWARQQGPEPTPPYDPEVRGSDTSRSLPSPPGGAEQQLCHDAGVAAAGRAGGPHAGQDHAAQKGKGDEDRDHADPWIGHCDGYQETA